MRESAPARGVTTDELRLKHLDDIGAVIGRLSHHSFIIRGWSVTLVSVLLAIIGQAPRMQPLILVALVPTLIFWGLDAYYLRRERLFRQLYTAVGRLLADTGSPHVELFDMNADRRRHETASFVRTLFTTHVLAIPLMLVVLIMMYAGSTLMIR